MSYRVVCVVSCGVCRIVWCVSYRVVCVVSCGVCRIVWCVSYRVVGVVSCGVCRIVSCLVWLCFLRRVRGSLQGGIACYAPDGIQNQRSAHGAGGRAGEPLNEGRKGDGSCGRTARWGVRASAEAYVWITGGVMPYIILHCMHCTGLRKKDFM